MKQFKRLSPFLFALLLFSCTEETTFQDCIAQFPVFEFNVDRLTPFKEASTENPLQQEEADFLLQKLGLEQGRSLIPFAKLILKQEQHFSLLLFENKDKDLLIASFDSTETLIDQSNLPPNAQLDNITQSISDPLPYLSFSIEKPRLNRDYQEEIPAIYTQTISISPAGLLSADEATFNSNESIPLLRKNNEYCGKFTYKRPKVRIELSLFDGKGENSYAYDLYVKTYNGCQNSIIAYRGITLNNEKEIALQEAGLLKFQILDKNTVLLSNRNFIKNCQVDWPFDIKLRREGTWEYLENNDGSWTIIEEIQKDSIKQK